MYVTTHGICYGAGRDLCILGSVGDIRVPRATRSRCLAAAHRWDGTASGNVPVPFVGTAILALLGAQGRFKWAAGLTFSGNMRPLLHAMKPYVLPPESVTSRAPGNTPHGPPALDGLLLLRCRTTCIGDSGYAAASALYESSNTRISPTPPTGTRYLRGEPKRQDNTAHCRHRRSGIAYCQSYEVLIRRSPYRLPDVC